MQHHCLLGFITSTILHASDSVFKQERKQVIGGGHALGTEHTRSRLVIHHYVVKSLEDFEAKRKRGNVYSLGRRPSVCLFALISVDAITKRSSYVVDVCSRVSGVDILLYCATLEHVGPYEAAIVCVEGRRARCGGPEARSQVIISLVNDLD